MPAPPILLIHGAWLTPAIWQPWRARYEAAGHTTLAPAWPLLDEPKQLGGLTLRRIVEHYAAIIAGLPKPPVIIGHSYGGLVTQMLLERGLGAAGVSLDPGPAAGIKPGPKAFRAALPVFLAWAGWSRALRMSYASFARDFANALPEAQRRAAYDRHIVQAPGRIYYQSVLGIGSGIDWKKDRPPLLLVSGDQDRTVEPGMVRQAVQRYAASPAVTDFVSFPGRGHFLIAEPGWEAVADHVLGWAMAHAGAPARRPQGVAA